VSDPRELSAYQADAFEYGRDGYSTQLEAMLAEGWTIDDPAALDKVGLRLDEDGSSSASAAEPTRANNLVLAPACVRPNYSFDSWYLTRRLTDRTQELRAGSTFGSTTHTDSPHMVFARARQHQRVDIGDSALGDHMQRPSV
jgi:hypothetical protein